MVNLFKKLVLAGGLLTCVALFPSAASAQTYDPAAEFSSTQGGTTGVWRYGRHASGGGTFGNLNGFTTGFAGFPIDAHTQSGGVPAIGITTAPLVVGAPDSYSLAAGRLWLHPGDDDNSPAIIRFTAPTSGFYRVSGTWRLLSNNSGGAIVSVVRGSKKAGQLGTDSDLNPAFDEATILSSAGITVPLGPQNTFAFDHGTNLLANQTINLIAARGNSNLSDHITIDAGVITREGNLQDESTPEPASLLLLAAGIPGLVALRRKRS